MLRTEILSEEAGFTLVEVIASFVILAMVLGTVTLSLSYSTRLFRNAETKRSALSCAQRVLAESFARSTGLPESETGAGTGDCRWRISRKIARTSYTAGDRNLMSYRLEVLGRDGRMIEAFDTYYVEAVP